MFGGVGLYCDGIFFGLIARDQLYLEGGRCDARSLRGGWFDAVPPVRRSASHDAFRRAARGLKPRRIW
jgi:hypothetical protein